jgi:hypothetical protein
MFLLEALAFFTAAFWMSAAVAQAVLRSPAERALSPVTRAGFGFFVALVFFSAAWQFVTIGWAWIAGTVLLASYAAAMGWPPRGAWRGYMRAYPACMAGAGLYFLPMLLAWAFGPFTEGGGDISIYADTAKYLVDHGLTETGYAELDTASPKMNPPLADYATYRVLAAGAMSKYLYAPYGMFTLPVQPANYAAFHGIQALVYVFIIAACWDFFRRHGRTAALLGVGFVLASHGLVSVFYNSYSAQSISLAACALMLAAYARIPLISWAGFRTYGCALLVTFVCYVLYLGVLLPIAVAALRPVGRFAIPRLRWPALAAAGTFLALSASLAWAGTRLSWEMAVVYVQGALTPGAGLGANPYMGAPVEAFSAKWFAFAFGLLSQQHVMPLVAQIGVVDLAMRAAAVVGLACVLGGMWVLVRAQAAGTLRPMGREAALYALALVFALAHLYMVRKSMYTQAKGAQNVLLLVYAVMVIPIAFAAQGQARMRRFLVALMAALIALSLVPRATYMLRFAGGFDRTSILEASYFEEAQRIRRTDPRAFVLVEGRVSADLYAASQPFFGARMLPTRHIVIKKADLQTGPYGVVATVPDFIAPEDLPHLWLLRPHREPKWRWLEALPYVSGYLTRPSYRTTWHAERLADAGRPTVILTGDLYERASERTARSAMAIGPNAPAGFAGIRNGFVTIFVPAQIAAVVTLEARPAAGVEPGADAKITSTGDALKMEYALPAASHAAFRVVARCRAECLVRVQVDGKDVD